MQCPECGIEISSQAELFLHQQLHDEPWSGFGNARNLNALPYVLMPRIAKLMEDYHASRLVSEKVSSNA